MKAKAPLIVTSLMIASSLALPVVFAASQSSKDMYRSENRSDSGSSPSAHGGKHGKKGPIKIKIDHDVVMADDLMMKGKFSEAAEAYHQATIKKPDNVPATIGYGMALAKQFKLDAANDQFDKALAIDPNNAMAHSGKAMVMFNRLQSSSKTVINNKENLLKQAEEECKKGLAIDPGMPEAHYTLGMIYKEQGRLDDAEGEFKEATKIDPQYSEAFAGLGITQLTKNDLEGALQSFKTAASLNSGNSTAHYGLGKVYVKQGNFDDAIKELNTSLYQNPNSAPARLAMGEAYAGQGNTVAAIKDFQESIRIKPENVEAYLHIADVREARGDLEHSIAELRSGLELLPNATELHSRIGDESLKLEKLDDAIKEYQTVLNQNPSDANAAKGLTQAFCMKGSKEATGAYFESNEFESAKAYIDKAVSMNPNDMQLRLAAAKLRVLSGEDVDLSKIGTPANDGDRIAYSQALLIQNKFKDADAQMATVINNAQDAKAAYAIGDMALLNHDLSNAEAAYKKAASFTHSEERSKRSMDQVAHAKDIAKQDLTLADDLSRKKQLASAVDKYHNSIYENPKVAQARIGLAQTLERESPPESKDIRAAIVQWHAYLDLSPDLLPKEVEKINKHLVALDKQATKLEAKEAKEKGKPVKKKK
jgi:tetratricopeptide (TPR) repeat protein